MNFNLDQVGNFLQITVVFTKQLTGQLNVRKVDARRLRCIVFHQLFDRVNSGLSVGFKTVVLLYYGLTLKFAKVDFGG
jgi:hypothetical protein